MQMLLLFIVGTASAIIIACGFILSRVLSRQILTPLAALRTAAAEIEKGNLDYELRLSSRDELGRTCEAFDHMRRQLRSARLAQEKYEQNRKELIAGISHDLSTPLTLLKGYASGILVGIAKTAEKRHHYVELIYQNACTLEKLVDRLFLFSKLDLGQVSFMMERVSLRDYFADFAAENTERLAERGLILHYSPPAGPAWTAIDRMQFQRVIDNLLENALKYKEALQSPWTCTSPKRRRRRPDRSRPRARCPGGRPAPLIRQFLPDRCRPDGRPKAGPGHCQTNHYDPARPDSCRSNTRRRPDRRHHLAADRGGIL